MRKKTDHGKKSSRRNSATSNHDEDSVFSSSNQFSVRGEIAALMFDNNTTAQKTSNKSKAGPKEFTHIYTDTGALVIPDIAKQACTKKEKLSVLLIKEPDEELDYFQKVDMATMTRYDKQTA